MRYSSSFLRESKDIYSQSSSIIYIPTFRQRIHHSVESTMRDILSRWNRKKISSLNNNRNEIQYFLLSSFAIVGCRWVLTGEKNAEIGLRLCRDELQKYPKVPDEKQFVTFLFLFSRSDIDRLRIQQFILIKLESSSHFPVPLCRATDLFSPLCTKLGRPRFGKKEKQREILLWPRNSCRLPDNEHSMFCQQKSHRILPFSSLRARRNFRVPKRCFCGNPCLLFHLKD